MTYEETEIVADAGTRLRIIADGMLAAGGMYDAMDVSGGAGMREFSRMVDEVRVRLCALPLEPEGEAA